MCHAITVSCICYYAVYSTSSIETFASERVLTRSHLRSSARAHASAFVCLHVH